MTMPNARLAPVDQTTPHPMMSPIRQRTETERKPTVRLIGLHLKMGWLLITTAAAMVSMAGNVLMYNIIVARSNHNEEWPSMATAPIPPTTSKGQRFQMEVTRDRPPLGSPQDLYLTINIKGRIKKGEEFSPVMEAPGTKEQIVLTKDPLTAHDTASGARQLQCYQVHRGPGEYRVKLVNLTSGKVEGVGSVLIK